MTTQTLLVVEDDPDHAQLISTILEQQGYLVINAAGVDEALSVLKNRDVDLLISDIMMPGPNGLKLVNHLRKYRQLRNLPIIIITAGREDLQMDSLMAGADLFCRKSDVRALLLEQVEMLLKEPSDLDVQFS